MKLVQLIEINKKLTIIIISLQIGFVIRDSQQLVLIMYFCICSSFVLSLYYVILKHFVYEKKTLNVCLFYIQPNLYHALECANYISSDIISL